MATDLDTRRTIDPDLPLVYDSLRAFYAHEEQERWSSLYNYLMASTILLLAWATVFVATTTLPRRTIVLALLASSGIVLSILWILFGARVNSFVEEYRRVGETLEERLGMDAIGPFLLGRTIRHVGHPDRRDALARLGSLIRARYFYASVPALFVIVYVLLLAISVVG